MDRKTYFTRMGHAALQVSDLDRALSFYQSTLGMDAKWVGDDDWAQVSLGRDELSLIRERGAVHPPHLGFRVSTREDLVNLHTKLVEKNVFVETIEIHRDATQSFYFRDPDGNWLEALWDPSEKTL